MKRAFHIQLMAFSALLVFLFLSPPSFAVTIDPGDIIVADPSANGGTGAIFKVDPSTGTQTVISSNTVDPSGTFVNPIGAYVITQAVGSFSVGDLIVVDDSALPSGPNKGAIYKVTPSTGVQTILSSGNNFVLPRDVVVDQDGYIIVTDIQLNAVIRVDPSNGNQMILSDMSDYTYVNPYGIAIDANGDLIFADDDASGPGGSGVIFKLTHTGVGTYSDTPTVISSGQLFAGGPNGLDIAPGSLLGLTLGDIVTADVFTPAGIIKIDPVTGVQTLLYSGSPFVNGAGPIDIAFEADGMILATDISTDTVYRLNPQTLMLSVVSAGGSFVNPFGVTVSSVSSGGGAPVPEPSTLFLLGAGLFGAARFRRSLRP